MDESREITLLLRYVVVFSVLLLLGALLYHLFQAGYSHSRLVLFALIAVSAVIGGVGVILRRPVMTMVGIISLVLFYSGQSALTVPLGYLIVVLLVAWYFSPDRLGSVQ